MKTKVKTVTAVSTGHPIPQAKGSELVGSFIGWLRTPGRGQRANGPYRFFLTGGLSIDAEAFDVRGNYVRTGGPETSPRDQQIVFRFKDIIAVWQGVPMDATASASWDLKPVRQSLSI